MTFTCSIDLDNAAFEDDPGLELARILRVVADEIEANGPDENTVRDVDGNTVGRWSVNG